MTNRASCLIQGRPKRAARKSLLGSLMERNGGFTPKVRLAGSNQGLALASMSDDTTADLSREGATGDAVLALAAEFPPASRSNRAKFVDGVLKGAPFERLIATTYDGIQIQPLYERAAAAQPVFARRGGAPWRIVQRIEHPDPAAANAQAQDDLRNGATGLALAVAGSPGAYGFERSRAKATR